MEFALWCLIVGALLISMALAGSVLHRMPISTSMLYLGVGVLVGPAGLDMTDPDPFADALVLERLAEVAVLVSLFTSGLKLSPALSDRRWRLPLRLAFGSMAITVALIAGAAMLLFGLPIGTAVLLGAVLAPTDPVLASEVQVEEPTDRDRLRFALTGEGGLNDGTAFPFVMLGLGLMGLHELGEHGLRWVAIDVLWATIGGLAIGALLGTLIGRAVLYLRRHHKEAVGLDDFLALGLIALSYGTALAATAYGFLAVFAAGVALRRIERVERPLQSDASGTAAQGGSEPAVRAPGDVAVEALTTVAPIESEKIATDPNHAPAFMARAVLGFNQQIERIGEVTVVIAIGAMLSLLTLPTSIHWSSVALFVVVLFLVIRPVSVLIGLAGSRTSSTQRALVAWFGVRGIGSLYYLMYAINHGVEQSTADTLFAITLSVVVASIVAHGISVTPLMAIYARKQHGGAQG